MTEPYAQPPFDPHLDLLVEHLLVSEEAMEHLRSFGSEHLMPALSDVHTKCFFLDKDVSECTCFTILDSETIETLYERDKRLVGSVHWNGVTQSLILISRSMPRAVQKLIAGIGWALAAKNEILLALSVRAFMEQASALFSLREQLNAHKEQLSTEAWLNRDWSIMPSDSDRTLLDALLRYLLGRRIDSRLVASPDSLGKVDKTNWKEFTKRIQINKTESLAATQVLNDIDAVREEEGWYHWRAVYEELCEYCHPNSASRLVSFGLTVSNTGTFHIAETARSEFNLGFLRVFHFADLAIPIACRIISEAIGAISNSRPELPPLYGSVCTDISPVGSVRGVDEYGREFWVDCKSLSNEPLFAPAQLAEEQLSRITRVVDAFDDTVNSTLEQWIARFSTELDPEAEINLYEHLAAVYKEEMAERSNMNRDARRLLHRAIVLASFAKTLDELLSGAPDLKRLRKLNRIFRRVHSR